MLNQTIEQIRGMLLQANTYFNDGYSGVVRNTTKGLISKDGKAIFPNDTKGNYFYLRLANNITFTGGGINQLADAIIGVGVTAQIVLVASVQGADADKLLSNLINTLQVGCHSYISSFDSAVFYKDEVINQELQFMSDESREKALRNTPKNLCLVSLTFTIQAPFVYSQCIENPCGCN